MTREYGSADYELPHRGLADRGLADRGLADRGLADRGLADRGLAQPRLPRPARPALRRELSRVGWAARAALAAGATALLAACSGGGAGTGPGSAPVASLAANSHTGHGSATQLTQEQSDLDMIHFARCMRSHGVAVSDPFHRPGHAGLSIDMPTQDAATRPAYAVCGHFMQPIIQAKAAGGRSNVSPAQMAALTSYAECMRSHNIPMLDPDANGSLNLGHVPGITSDFGRYSPQFRAADTACRHLLPPGVHDDGTGP